MFRVKDNSRQRNAAGKAARVQPATVLVSADFGFVQASGATFSLLDSRAERGRDYYGVRAFSSDGETYLHCECKAGVVGQTNAESVTEGETPVLDGQPCYHAMNFLRERDARKRAMQQAAQSVTQALDILRQNGVQLVVGKIE